MSRTSNLGTPTGRARAAPSQARLRLGVLLVVLALAAVPFGFAFGAAHAQEAADPSKAKPLSVDKVATYTHNLGNTAPPSITDQFPPQALCLVAPEFCSEDAEQISDPVNDVVAGDDGEDDNPLEDAVDPEDDGTQPEDTVPSDPATLARPGDLPVSILLGAPRHESAIKFELPEVPDGHQVSSFRVFLRETDPTYHSDSPAFRQGIVAALQLAARQDPSEIDKIPEEDLVQNEELQGVEACPIVEPFEEGRGRPGSEAPKDSTEADEPGLDCALGANGQRIFDEDGTVLWVFDLTFAADAWNEGEIPNEGVLFRPVAAPNLAHGDPDLTTSEQVTFEGPAEEDASDEERAAAPAFTMSTEPKPEPVSFDDFPTVQQQSGTTSASEPPSSGSAPQTFTETVAAPPSTAEPPPTTQPSTPPPTSDETQVAAPALSTSDPVTEPWVWLFVPALLAGGYLTTQALTASPQVAVERSGAMTRLIESRR